MANHSDSKHKIKILYLISSLKKCGPINVLYNIIKDLDSQTFDIFLVSLSKAQSKSLIDQFEALDITIISIDQSRFKGLFLNEKIVQKLIKNKQIDIVHSHGFRADMINVKLKLVTTINTIHNFPPEDYLNRYGRIMGSWMSIEHKNIIKNIHVPIACSKAVMQKFKDHFNIKTECIQNGINLENFIPYKENKNVLRKSLNLPSNKVLFIVSGAISQLKNPKVIINAFNLLNNSDHVLIFIGNGKLFDSLSRAHTSSNIQFMGRVEKVSQYLQASDFYVSASLTEGFPNSVLEAISSGLPTILSNIPAHVEIIGDNYPYLFDPKSAKDLSEKLNMIVSKKNKHSAKLHSLKIKNDFKAQLMSHKYEQVYLTATKPS